MHSGSSRTLALHVVLIPASIYLLSNQPKKKHQRRSHLYRRTHQERLTCPVRCSVYGTVELRSPATVATALRGPRVLGRLESSEVAEHDDISKTKLLTRAMNSYLFDTGDSRLRSGDLVDLGFEETGHLERHRSEMVHRVDHSLDGVLSQGVDDAARRMKHRGLSFRFRFFHGEA